MKTKIIKNENQYQESLERLEKLIMMTPEEGSEGRELIETLSVLIEEYEERVHQVDLPDPVEAIKFRMEQEDLRQRDLIPFLGSRSKVSEILNYKRSLSLSMIRALNIGLKIPAEVLIQNNDPSNLEYSDIDWRSFPLDEMKKRGWIAVSGKEIQEDPLGVMQQFLEPLGGLRLAAALYRKTDNIRSARTMDRYALAAWTARVQKKALERERTGKFSGEISTNTMKELVHLSLSEKGPRLAVDFLAAMGINLIIEKHLPGTYLDGAALMGGNGNPIIGMTLRYDRVDNFWFTLLHELSHVKLHLAGGNENFFDDLDFEEHADPKETEADNLAAEVLIPNEEWGKSPASKLKSAEAATHLANRLDIHPAIVAGRMRHYYDNYKILTQLVGYDEVRILFPEIDWEE